jgi:His/Glu/Gln/Arg/opine family amino acid ABC transporter permease subunit
LSYVFHWSVIKRYSDFFYTALYNTFNLSVVSIFLALVVGVFFAVARNAGIKPLQLIAKVYIITIRSTPLLVQLYLIYFGLPYLNINIPSFWCGVIALVLNSGAYVAEIVRAGLQSISMGQKEASTALGLNNLQTMRYVILPQTLRKVIPPLIGQFTYLVKDTSILAAIGIYELTNTANVVHSRTFRPIESFSIALACYLLLNLILILGSKKIEQKVALQK